MHPGSAAVGVIVVAAGSGSRLGADVPKAFVPLAGVPLLGHALRGALSCPGVAEVVVVAPGGWVDAARAVCRWARSQPPAPSSSGPGVHSGEALQGVDDGATRVGIEVVAGGAERGDSVAAGLAALSAEVGIVLVHDAARCLAPTAVFERVVTAVRAGAAAAVPGVPVVDTVKEVDESGRVVGTPDRSRLRAVQTPQGFRRDVLERAHAVSSAATDDAALVERLGETVLVVDGDPLALKVTTPADLDAAARILAG
ncbi:2-C-methyl-D-erythritol 4-phosphate cytidylyltransferase [Intrasporangium sp. DVR]|uniref:2-C-methyl-D-erythritol 4-phosphate cytidylyltransferase n=1 Tax=Intrasporangium sp. DVR TaxID=3127867 RepID=UPI00313A6F1F